MNTAKVMNAIETSSRETTKTELNAKSPGKPRIAQEPPIFNLKEYDSHYMFSIDLPSLEAGKLGIEVTNKRLQLIENGKSKKSSASVLFQCEPLGNKVKAYYQGGVLWVMLPKNSLADLLDLPRLARAIA